MDKYKILLVEQERKLTKALGHLDFSFKKVQTMITDVEELDDAGLEVWESFVSRFARVVDLYLTKYVRTYVLCNDPGYAGSLRDFVNQGEKLGVVDNADNWMALRELRNISAHDYTEEELAIFFQQVRTQTKTVLKLINHFHKS